MIRLSITVIITGKYRQALHSSCNLHYKIPNHNTRKYDTHLIMQDLGRFKGLKLACIAKNAGDYISFQVDNIRFLDSFQFMASSLDTLVGDLFKSGKEKFKLTQSCFPDNEQFNLMLRKGV